MVFISSKDAPLRAKRGFALRQTSLGWGGSPRICRYYNHTPITDEIQIRFKKDGDGLSKAHVLANKTYKGRKREDYLIKSKDIDDLKNIIKIVLNW